VKKQDAHPHTHLRLCGGILIVVAQVIEFRFLVVEHSIEIYGGSSPHSSPVSASGW
jgi:hypothetical protein